MKAMTFFWAVAASFAVVPVYAADTSSPDPSSLEVAGVRLGMTVDEAANALKKFDDKYKVTKLYSTDNFEQTRSASAMEDIPASDKGIAFFSKLQAKHEASLIPCPQSTTSGGSLSGGLMRGAMGVGNGCGSKFTDDEETVTVEFSPVPGQERVIGVSRDKIVHLEPAPTIESIVHGLLGKYGAFTPTYSGVLANARPYDVYWLFDGKKRLLSLASAKSLSARDGYYCVNCDMYEPSFVSFGEGVSLRVEVYPKGYDAVDSKLAKEIYMGLWDGDALMKAIGQSKATFKALKDAADKKELDKSADSPSKTKF